MSEKLLNQMMSELQSIKENMATKSDLKQIKSEVGQVRTKLQDFEFQTKTRFDTLEAKLALLQEGITRIEENGPQKVIGMLNQIQKSQEKQDKILASLSMRSLEQETEIKEIRRAK